MKRVSRVLSVLALVTLLAFVPVACGGPIPAPGPVVDLRTNPTAFQEQFDAAVGAPRLVLMLSPA